MQRHLLFWENISCCTKRGFFMQTDLKVHDKNHSCAQKKLDYLHITIIIVWQMLQILFSSLSRKLERSNRKQIMCNAYFNASPVFFADASKRFRCTWNHLRTWKPNIVGSVPHFTTAHCTQTKCLWLTELNLSWPETEAKLLNVR